MRWLHVAVARPPLLLAMVAVLLAMGRSPLCSCGVALWSGDIWSPSASQLVADAYSFVHVLHGLLFYWLTRAVWRGASVQSRLVYVTTFAVAWS